MAQSNDIWLAGEIPKVQAKPGTVAPVAMQMMKGVDSFDLGLRLKRGLDLELNVFADSPVAASNLTKSLQAMVQLAAASQKDPQANDFLSRLNMGNDGDRIQMTASWSQSELAAVFQTRNAAGLPGSVAAARLPQPVGASAQPVSAPPKPREPLKVKIYNPDGPVKEFELARD